MSDLFETPRNSKMVLNEVYLWTTTIKEWKHLLKPIKYKELIISILKDLTDKKFMTIYGFVIMPNHLHILWKLNMMNGKEMPYASFNKATAHELRKDLKQYHPQVLAHFKVSEKDRSYRIWQRDPLAIHIDAKWKFEQKLEYIHNNPLNDRWNLSKSPETYQWSSASFYETGIDQFECLSHYQEYFG
ncbi:MAG: REP element-mobilizing transposase RayT [Marinoscillum sp.]|jgi:REP element-mobilizing transposase RayT